MSEAQQTTPYNERFFRGNASSAEGSARPVLTMLRELYSPTSIVDVGCGSGGWLAMAKQVGFTDLRGYDGPWADPSKFSGAEIEFIPLDMEKNDLVIDRRFDLAMSVEVAEHLTEARSDVIVDALCGASDVVLFGAAGPFQGGVHHVFERPQSYWIAKFDARGYDVLDIIRPVIWNDNKVRWWFRQNTFLFVKRGSTVLDVDALRERERNIIDLVHPASLERRVKTLWSTQRELKAALARANSAEARVVTLQSRLARAKDRNGALEKKNADLRAKLPWYRTLTADQVPSAVRPAVVRAWRSLPSSVRRRLRRR